MSETKSKTTVLGRRQVLKAAGLGALAVAGTGLASRDASATADTANAAIAKFTGGKAATTGKVTVKLPEIAENGRTVPVTVVVDSPMTAGDHVKSIILVAEGNPQPDVVSFNLTPGLGKAEISSRMRLGKTQNVSAAAVMSDGSVFKGTKKVKVTIGGCGG